MPAHLVPLAAGAVTLAVAAALPNAAHPEGDRRPGIYQFQPLPEGWCADHAPQAYHRDAPARLTPLGDLPPAYAIRLSAPASTAQSSEAGQTSARPAYDPCARSGPAVVRVR